MPSSEEIEQQGEAIFFLRKQERGSMGKSVPRDILERARRLASVGGDPDLMVWWEHGWRAGYRSIEDYGHKSFTEVDPEIAEIMERRKREKRE